MISGIAFYAIGPTAVVLYLLFIYFGTKMMKTRKAFDLHEPLKYWNLMLAMFSASGSFHLVTHVFYVLYKFGFMASFCLPPVYFYRHETTEVWVLLFKYSKYVELIDTVFIVLQKKKLGFLHWYHHSTVLLYTWDSCYVDQPCGQYFMAMNYCVHTVMYFYFFMAGQCKRRLSWGVFVTAAQITQMFLGIVITFVSLYYAYSYPSHPRWDHDDVTPPLKDGVYISKGNVICGMLMYSTYFYLFAEFFLNRYLFSSSSSTGKPEICTASARPAVTKSSDDEGSTSCCSTDMSEQDNNKARPFNICASTISSCKPRRSTAMPATPALLKRRTQTPA
eukprot:GHVS01072928.1.p1 GENE.GHVS01072928.1~~GHVS01072928.1.p1  ORF type:complete len:334 (-),score=18.52 GHVS01072928.1:643-1644(-)